MKARRKRTVVHGELADGIAYRAHFDGEPSAEALAALEEIVKAARRCLDGTCEHPACVARREAERGR